MLELKAWWITNLIMLILFGLTTVFLMMRRVDGTGAVQTTGDRLAAIGVLGVVLLVVVIIQLIRLALIRKRLH
ncbi:DUF3923 family protein [Lentilactobacillus raoultii]|uniref:DUF3923 family protein n=1 Tax=Lentilactobacillus raoultii TaxID=1987503 RepID=A0ABW3PMS7_9LACO|nr:DUF3923 family protein [Lentilactobacillus raoultii]